MPTLHPHSSPMMSSAYVNTYIAATSPLQPKRYTSPADPFVFSTPISSPMFSSGSTRLPKTVPTPNKISAEDSKPSRSTSPPVGALTSSERVRPLPQPPSKRPYSESSIVTHIRPLPQTPRTPSLSPTSTPATTPSPPSTPRQEDVIPTSLLAPRTASLRPSLPRLQVPLLVPPIDEDAPGTAVSALSFMPPSPATRHRRTVSKLARHLGEDIPVELLSGSRVSHGFPRLSGVDEDVIKGTLGDLVFAPFSAVDADDDTEKGDSIDIRRSEPTALPANKKSAVGWVAGQPTNGNLVFERGHHRLSRHWYREEQGRLVEQDPRDIVNTLRTLW